MSEDYMVRFAAPTLAGLKTGSLFTCDYESRENFLREAREYDRLLSPRGVRLLVLRFSDRRALVYIYRPALLARDLRAPAAARLLREEGYADLRPGRCLGRLVEKLRAPGGFPHEIGLFLGYPPEDVLGFIRTGGRNCKCVGCWKVYGDAERAKKLFASYERCTEIYCRSCQRGIPLQRLAVALGPCHL